MIRPNQAIYLVISNQPPPLLMPNLVNTQPELAKQALNSLNIRSKLIQVPSAYPEGHTIGQTPLPHAPTDGEPAIIYCAQKSRKPILWPDFVQQPADEALAFLAYHQIPAQITRKNGRSGGPASGTIVDQRPLAGSLLEIDPKHPPMVQLEVA